MNTVGDGKTTQFSLPVWTHQLVASVNNSSSSTTTTTTTTPTGNLSTDSWCEHLKDSDFVHSIADYSTATRTAVALAFIALLVVNVIGNSVVILAVILDRPLREITSSLIISLAAADILVALSAEVHSIVLIVRGDNLHVSQIMCKVSTSADLYFSLCELLHLACLATERCLAICYPFQYERIGRKFLISILVLAWTVPLLFSFLPILLFEQMVGQRTLYDCLQHLDIGICTFLPNHFFSTLLFTVMFILPSSVMFYCYTRIGLVVCAQKKRIKSMALGTFATRSRDSSRDETANGAGKELVLMTLSYHEKDLDLDPDLEQGEEVEADLMGSHLNELYCNPISEPIRFSRRSDSIELDVNHRTREAMGKSGPDENAGKNKREDFNAARSIGLLCLFFLITWGPYWLAVLLLPFMGYQNRIDFIIAAALWLNFLGTALNPFIYYFSNTAVREGILRLCRRLLNRLPKMIVTFVQNAKR